MHATMRRCNAAGGFTLIEVLLAIVIALLLILIISTLFGEIMQLRASNVTGISFTGPSQLGQGQKGVFKATISLDDPAPDKATFDVSVWEGDGPADDLLAKYRVSIAKGANTAEIDIPLRCRVLPTPALLIGANGADDDDASGWEIYFYIDKVDDETVIDLAGNYSSDNHALECLLVVQEEED